jgi:hypothetical protein
MPSGTKKTGLIAPATLSAAVLPAITAVTGAHADAALSSAFRNALGSSGNAPHLPAPTLTPGQELSKRAKADKPAARFKGAPHSKANIGPRSGHK